MASSTRDALIEAATDLLDEGGPASVTMREVGRRAGVSHNAPYKHFADKEALLACVAARELDRYTALIEPPTTNVATTFTAYVERALRYPARFRLVFGRWTIEDSELGRAADAASVALLNVVIDAQATGQLPDGDPAALAELLRATAHGAIDLELGGHLAKGASATTPASLLDRLVTLLAP
ncbi:TetR/AcrR family transcriptional regulator [Millisia brevis]|uniref:TetR/AcrR family transcriptional regulator n=1 Tax=Millisia brevis TaxID=264148 RepID=UPI00082A544A|nr:TetR/AcrR family transcriptional regulator [Millisia brevis]